MKPHDFPTGDTGQPPAGGPVIGPTPAPALHVMSWNIRRRLGNFSTRPAERWQLRGPRLRALLQAEKPTLLGVQEALAEQTRFVGESLGAQYASVGHGREASGGGEGCPLFYDGQRLELLEWEQHALSETPSVPGSRSWGNLLPRIMVSATFLDRATGRHFLAINTHFDHLSRRSRLRSAQALGRLVSASGLPTVVTGDLNAHAASPPLLELLAGSALADTWEGAQHRTGQEWGTWARYREPGTQHPRLDWILVSPQWRIDRAGINAQRYHGGWASDHLPVHAVLRLPRPGGAA